MKVIKVEKNMEFHIRNLIELDSKALQIKKQKDTEIAEFEARCKNELGSLNAVLVEAAALAKQRHDEILEDARKQAEELDNGARLQMDAMQAAFLNFKEEAARTIWKQLLDIER